jgi:hypothetical protein
LGADAFEKEEGVGIVINNPLWIGKNRLKHAAYIEAK